MREILDGTRQGSLEICGMWWSWPRVRQSALDEDTLAVLVSPQVEVHRDVKRAEDLVKEEER